MSLLPYMKVKYRVFERISDSDMEDFYVFRKLLLRKLNSTVKITYLDTDESIVIANVYRLGKMFVRDLVWQLEIIGEKQQDIKEFKYVKERIIEESKRLFKHCVSISIYSPIISKKYRVIAAEIVLRKMGFSKVENHTIQSSNGPEKVSFVRENVAAKIYQNSIEIFSKDLSIQDTIVEEFRKTCEKIFEFDIFNKDLQVHEKEGKIVQILRRISKGYGKIAIIHNKESYLLYVSGNFKPLLRLMKKISADTMLKIVFDVKKCGYRLYGTIYIKNPFYGQRSKNFERIKKIVKNKIMKVI
ncbi:MAG: hypothetical protein ACTSYM_11975 [Candidatus Baldrarchaeia archaeon]